MLLNAPAPLVGLIANPASGKDVRRLVAHATTVDNQGKIGILRRVLVGLGVLGIARVGAMPDTHNLVTRALEGLGQARGPLPAVALLEMPVTGQALDSERAARLLQRQGAGCIIVLGGDGTVRMASKGAGNVPILPISTGTNNVLPGFVEGTLAGLAAGAVARGQVPLEAVAVRHKWLELTLNGTAHDRALVDVAALAGRFIGARAVWEVDDLRQVVVTRADPATIGISAIVGGARPVAVEEPVGVAVWLAPDGGQRVLAAIGPGLVAEVGLAALEVLPVGETVNLVEERPLVLALDGEREVVLHAGDTASLTLRADGPWIVDARRVLAELAARRLLHRARP